MPYFMVFTRDALDAPWAPQFGDHDRTTVDYEAYELTRDLPRGFRAKASKVVRFPRVPTQRQVTAKAAELNLIQGAQA